MVNFIKIIIFYQIKSQYIPGIFPVMIPRKKISIRYPNYYLCPSQHVVANRIIHYSECGIVKIPPRAQDSLSRTRLNVFHRARLIPLHISYTCTHRFVQIIIVYYVFPRDKINSPPITINRYTQTYGYIQVNIKIMFGWIMQLKIRDWVDLFFSYNFSPFFFSSFLHWMRRSFARSPPSI